MCQMRGGWGNNEDKYLVGDMRQYEQMMKMYVSSLELSPIYDSIWKIHGDFGIVYEHLYWDMVIGEDVWNSREREFWSLIIKQI